MYTWANTNQQKGTWQYTDMDDDDYDDTCCKNGVFSKRHHAKKNNKTKRGKDDDRKRCTWRKYVYSYYYRWALSRHSLHRTMIFPAVSSPIAFAMMRKNSWNRSARIIIQQCDMIWWCYECESLAKVTRKYFTSKRSMYVFSSPIFQPETNWSSLKSGMSWGERTYTRTYDKPNHTKEQEDENETEMKRNMMQ